MSINKIEKHLRTLATLPETDEPIISCYLPIDNSRIKDRKELEKCFSPIKDALVSQKQQLIRDALKPIRDYLANQLLPDTKGLVLFSRAGNSPFFLPIQFQVPMPYWVAVDFIPNIFHLAEHKDNFHRYVILIINNEGAQILEVNIGSITKELWTQRPELRRLLSREWTKTHYQKHPEKNNKRSTKIKVKILKRLMSKDRKTQLILLGDSYRIAEIKNNLPKHLLAKLVDLTPLSNSTEPFDAVKATIGILIRSEEEESQYTTEYLSREIKTGGFAIAGMKGCLKNLKENLVDTLIMLKSYSPGLGWICKHCGFAGFDRYTPSFCLTCEGHIIKKVNIREEMVRLAERIGAVVKIVGQNDKLDQLGGVGCLLRSPDIKKLS